MISGTVYGVVLNERSQIERLRPLFDQEPYRAPPIAPVVYIKPRNCVTTGGAAIILPHDLEAVEAAATIGLLFGNIPGRPEAAALALDICEPHESFYRPAVRQRARDGFLPFGSFAGFSMEALLDHDLVTMIDGVEAHRWSLRQLARSIPDLIAELRSFMSLLPGDVLLIGLPGDAPTVRAGQAVVLTHGELPTLSTRCITETAA